MSTQTHDDHRVIVWRQTSQSLAHSVQNLCGLCDDLISIINHTDIVESERHLTETIPARVDAVRQFARCIAAEANAPGSAATLDPDPYSLAQLRTTMDDMDVASS
jgi:hypothetical protein